VIDTIRETGGPVIAQEEMDSAFGKVEPGRVAGLHQTLSARRDGKEVLRLKMVMALGAPDPHDSATIHGEPPVRLKLEGGLWGDGATVSTLLNAVPRVIAAPPGLHTVLDLPVPRSWRPNAGGLTRKRRSP
jgi:4-hydroxy-tetrahydrodipicolinate reductase